MSDDQPEQVDKAERIDLGGIGAITEDYHRYHDRPHPDCALCYWEAS